MDKTKEDILQVTSIKEVLLWMQKHPKQADEEIAVHFNSLARKEYNKKYPDPDFLPTIPKRK